MINLCESHGVLLHQLLRTAGEQALRNSIYDPYIHIRLSAVLHLFNLIELTINCIGSLKWRECLLGRFLFVEDLSHVFPGVYALIFCLTHSRTRCAIINACARALSGGA